MVRWVSLCLGILLVVVVLAACTSTPQAATPPATKPSPSPRMPGAGSTAPPGSPRASPAASPTATRIETERITADGRLAFIEHRKLTFRTSGNVAKVSVSELDRVKKGQVLAKLDTTSLEQAVKAAELSVKAADLAVKTAEIDRKQVEDNVKAAGIDLELATDSMRKISYPYTYSTFTFDVPAAVDFIANARRQLSEAQKYVQPGATSEQYNEAARQLREAQEKLTSAGERLARGTGQDPFGESRTLAAKDFWTLRAAQLQMEKAQMAVENARTVLDKSLVSVDKAKNDVVKAANELDKAKDELEKAVITAPFDGIAARVDVKEGDFLYSGNYATTIAVEVIDPTRMELVVKVDEIDIPHVRVGQKVTIKVDALPDKPVMSTVTSIGSLPVVEAGVWSYEVKTVFDVPQNSALRSGMAATADITVAERTVAQPGT